MRNAAQTAFLMAVLTLISKLLGFIREMIIAGFYGTSYITDAYVMANAIPGIIFGGIFGAVSTAYMPVYSRIKEKDGIMEGDKFTSEIINLLIVLSLIIGLIGVVFSDQVVMLFASGFDGETADLTSNYIKITFFYVVFQATSGILSSYLQYKNVFLPQIVAGFTQNIGIIAVIIISAFTSHYYLAFGILVGTAANCLVTATVAKKRDFKYTTSLSFNRSVKAIMSLALPVFIGSSVTQINTFVDKTLASGLPEGRVAALNYAMLLVTLVTSLTTTILVTIIYPKITKANSLEAYDEFNEILGKGIIVIIIISLPCTLGSMLYNSQVVQIVYERGAFDPAATALTASAFLFYSMGLPFMALNALFTNIYYSMHDMKTPIIFGAIGVIINIVFNLILIRFMAHNGLALSTSIAAFVNSVLLYQELKRKYPHVTLIRSRKKIMKVILSAIVAVAASFILYHYTTLLLSHIIVARVVQLGLAVMFAGIVYLILLVLFKVDEVNLMKQLLKKR